MKILMLADSMGRGGTERRLTELLKGLMLIKDIKPELVVFSSKIQFDELFKLEIPIHIIERKFKKDVSIARDFYKLCYQIKPDILHSWGSMSTMLALPVKWFQKPILINSLITDAPPYLSIFDTRLLRFKLSSSSSDIILANSQAGLKSYHAPDSKSLVIYNGFDFNRLKNLPNPQTIREKWNIPSLKVIGMVAAFEPRKDYATFISLANKLLAMRSDVMFIAVGGGNLLEESKKLLFAEHTSRVLFTGNTPNVEEIIQIFDIGVLISNPKVHGEGISNAIMEYMAAGKPVIANDNGGNREIVVHDKTGYIIDEKNQSMWLSRINYLLDNPEVARQMGNLGLMRVEQTFSLKSMVSSFIELYYDLMNQK